MESPLKVVSTIANGNDLILNWDKTTYATDYNIYQVVNGTRTLAATTKSNSYTFVNHSEGTYSYEITSYNSRFGESAVGLKIEGEVIFPEIQSPIITYKIENGNDLRFDWQRVNFATNYKVYEVVDGERKLLTTTRLNSHLISNISEERHVYEVTTFNDRFGESEVPFRVEFDMVYPEMQAPEGLTYTLSNVNDINLRWSQAQYADSYKLYQIVNGEKKLISSSSALNKTFKNMPEGSYKYELASYSERFGESQQVANLEFDLIHPEMLAPENPTITVQNGNDFVLRWDAFEFATAYKVYQIIDGERKLIATKVGNAHTLVNIPEGNYTFEVTSYSDRFGESQNASRMQYELKFPEMQAPQLTGKVENENTMILDWTKTENASGYNIYQVIDGAKKFIGTTTSLQFKVSNKPEGQYTYEVTSYHSRFGESQSSNQVKLYIGPKLEAPKTSVPQIEDDSVTLSWGAVPDADSYNIYEVVNGELKLVENTTETSLILNNLEPDNYEYRIVPVAPSGVEAEAYGTIQVQTEQFDTIPPETSSNLTADWYKEDVQVQLTATDDQSGVDKTFYSIDESEFIEGNNFALTDAGTHKVSFYSVDKSGNVEEVQTVEVKVDKTAPVTTSDLTDDWYKKDVEVQLTATDDQSGVDKTFYSIDESEFIEGTSFILTTDGTHKVSFYSVDKAGNVEEVQTVEVKVDETAPVTTSNLTDDWYKEDVSVQLTATDDLSGVDKTFFSINGTEYKEGTSFTLTEEGTNKISFYSVDKAGNEEATQTVEVKVDETAPVTTSDITDEWYRKDVQVQLTATDDLSGVDKTFYSINGAEYKEGTNFTVTEEGTHKVSFYSVDKAGNVEEVQILEVKVDVTAPETTSDVSEGWYKNDAQVQLTATDDLSGVDKTYYSIDGSEYIEGASFSITEEGTHEISFYSIDKAGNLGVLNFAEIKIDKSAPTVSWKLESEYAAGTKLNLDYSATDAISGIASEKIIINGELQNNIDVLNFEKPGTYKIAVEVTDHAGWTTTLEKTIVVYIPATIEVLPKVIKGNNGVITVKVSVPQGYETEQFDLFSATLNGVQAIHDSNGMIQQAKKGQFKFERESFEWNEGEVELEFRAMLGDHLVVGSKTVKVLVK
jgi:uncharacterized protein YjiK